MSTKAGKAKADLLEMVSADSANQGANQGADSANQGANQGADQGAVPTFRERLTGNVEFAARVFAVVTRSDLGATLVMSKSVKGYDGLVAAMTVANQKLDRPCNDASFATIMAWNGKDAALLDAALFSIPVPELVQNSPKWDAVKAMLVDLATSVDVGFAITVSRSVTATGEVTYSTLVSDGARVARPSKDAAGSTGGTKNTYKATLEYTRDDGSVLRIVNSSRAFGKLWKDENLPIKPLGQSAGKAVIKLISGQSSDWALEDWSVWLQNNPNVKLNIIGRLETEVAKTLKGAANSRVTWVDTDPDDETDHGATK